MDLDGKTIAVTGASQGIGAAVFAESVAQPLETGAAAMTWMLAQSGPGYTGRLESLRALVERGLVAGKAAKLPPLSAAERWTW